VVGSGVGVADADEVGLGLTEAVGFGLGVVPPPPPPLGEGLGLGDGVGMDSVVTVLESLVTMVSLDGSSMYQLPLSIFGMIVIWASMVYAVPGTNRCTENTWIAEGQGETLRVV
jgi:hypothetical protein